MPPISQAPTEVPTEIKIQINELAKTWKKCPYRPRVTQEVEQVWNRFLSSWVESNLPLLIRKPKNNRGHVIKHYTGRELVPVDNSPSHWAYSLALRGECPSLTSLDMDDIPVAMVFKGLERENAIYTRTKQEINLNSLGWKVCHIDSVGLNTQNNISDIDIKILKNHFIKLLDPGNMFLLPKSIGALGEIDVFIREISNK